MTVPGHDPDSRADLLRIAVAGGAVHLVAVLVARTTLDRTAGRSTVHVDTLLTLGFLWVVLGAFLVGSVLALVYARYRLVLPAVVVAGLLAWSTYVTWVDYREAVAEGAAIGVSLRPFSVYALAWVLPLGIALVAGGLELLVRRVR